MVWYCRGWRWCKTRRRRRPATLTRRIPRRRRRDGYGSKGIWMSMITPPRRTPASPCRRTRGIPRPRPPRRPPPYLEQMSLDREVYSRRRSPARRLGAPLAHRDRESKATRTMQRAAVRPAVPPAAPTRRPRTPYRREEPTVASESHTCRTTPWPAHGNAGRRLLARRTKLKRTARNASSPDTAAVPRYCTLVFAADREAIFIVRRTKYHNFEPPVNRRERARDNTRETRVPKH